jgi:hypothetical protein
MAALCLTLALKTYGGPPFLTDDPEPVEYRHYEAYLFSTIDATSDGKFIQGPAMELNMGAMKNLQLHMIVPLAGSFPQGGPSSYGMGDIELGAKYRFLEETDHRPQAGIFPLLEIPSGDSTRGLGNGRTWAKLPLWLQKSWGPWTTYGGGGYAINGAPGQRNYAFGGWLLQRDLGEKLTLGGEVFTQGRSSDDVRAVTLFNLGGTYKFNENFFLLFSGGHTIAGQQNTVGYLGLYWTWGPDDHKEVR